MKLLSKLSTVFDRTIEILALLGILSIVAMMFLINADVLMRYFLNSPITGAYEISEILIVLSSFLGAAWILRQGGHIKVDILVNQLNPRAKKLYGFIISIVGAIVCLIIFLYGTVTTWHHFQRGVLLIGAFTIPKAPLLMVIPVTGLSLFIQFLRSGYGEFCAWRALSKDGPTIKN